MGEDCNVTERRRVLESLAAVKERQAEIVGQIRELAQKARDKIDQEAAHAFEENRALRENFLNPLSGGAVSCSSSSSSSSAGGAGSSSSACSISGSGFGMAGETKAEVGDCAGSRSSAEAGKENLAPVHLLEKGAAFSCAAAGGGEGSAQAAVEPGMVAPKTSAAAGKTDDTEQQQESEKDGTPETDRFALARKFLANESNKQKFPLLASLTLPELQRELATFEPLAATSETFSGKKDVTAETLDRAQREYDRDVETLFRVEDIGGSYDRGIVAKRDIEVGEIIFRENPVASLQHQYNKLCLNACHKCLKTVGSLRTRIGQVLRSDRGGPKFFEHEYPEVAFHSMLDLEYFSKKQLRYDELFRAPEDGEIFCSQRCYETDDVHKKLLYLRRTGIVWEMFEEYVVAAHEHCLLALKCLLSDKVGELYHLFSPKWSELEPLSEEWREVRREVVKTSYKHLQRLWEEVARRGEVRMQDVSAEGGRTPLFEDRLLTDCQSKAVIVEDAELTLVGKDGHVECFTSKNLPPRDSTNKSVVVEGSSKSTLQLVESALREQALAQIKNGTHPGDQTGDPENALDGGGDGVTTSLAPIAEAEADDADDIDRLRPRTGSEDSEPASEDYENYLQERAPLPSDAFAALSEVPSSRGTASSCVSSSAVDDHVGRGKEQLPNSAASSGQKMASGGSTADDAEPAAVDETRVDEGAKAAAARPSSGQPPQEFPFTSSEYLHPERVLPALCTEEEWDRLLGLADLTSKDLTASNPVNKQIIHARVDPKSRSFINETCKLLFGRVALSWRTTERVLSENEKATCADYHADDEENGRSLDLAAKSWKQSGKIFPSFEGLGVCRVVAFTNHSCFPNMEVSRIGETARIQGKAVRRIRKGENIYMSYIDEDSTLGYRQEELWTGYGFHCKCVKCKAEAAAIFVSLVDTVRKERKREEQEHEDEEQQQVLGDDAQLRQAVKEKCPRELTALMEFYTGYADRHGLTFENVCWDLISAAPIGTVWTWNYMKRLQNPARKSGTDSGEVHLPAASLQNNSGAEADCDAKKQKVTVTPLLGGGTAGERLCGPGIVVTGRGATE